VPRLWLFTDQDRLSDPRPAVARLPIGAAGVVFRHDGHPMRTALGKDLARICRMRRLTLVVAGNPRLAATLHAGIHLRSGRRPGAIRPPHGVITSSAHSIPDLRRAAKSGAHFAFLSPAFPTASHPGAPGLGPLRWAAMARRLSNTQLRIGALGGISGDTIRRLPIQTCVAAGAITAFSD
jgi:thiamine-phosphate pyrophosphorylase